jgi:hypothetical protein
MVVAPGVNGIVAHVILADGEALPQNLNSEKVVVYRRGKSTDMELLLVKPLGVLADADLLRDPGKPVCNFEGGPDPLHEHADGTFWFYEETWSLENGPFPTYDEAYDALAEYCVGLERVKENLENSLTSPENDDKVDNHENTELQSAPKSTEDDEVGKGDSVSD